MEFWVFILTLLAVYLWVHSRIRRKKEDQRFERVIEALNRFEPRLHDLKKLESRVAELEKQLASPAAPSALQPAPTPPPPTTAPKPVELPPPLPLPQPVQIPKPPTPAPPPLSQSHPPTPSEPSLPHKPAAPPPPPAAAHPPAPLRPLPSPLPPPPKPAPISASETTSQFEELLGKNWLNKIGIIAIVIGIAYFLGSEFHKLSNPAKIALCYFVSLLILGTGVYLERLNRYRVFARALIGGGWALVFFVTFAMYFVPYTRVIETQWVDLVLLFVVATVMVVHTLRYDSQVVTGLAFLLAFFTVGISLNTIYSLSAGAILALGLVMIVYRRQWFELEVFGILASYINHYIWLHRVIEPLVGRHRMFPEFVPSAILLCLYWAAYRWSYIARRVESSAQESVSTLAAILNTSLLLALFKYQSLRPELAFYVLLLLGGVELALGQLPVTRLRRIAFTILSSIGIVLIVAAIPFKYSGMDTAVIWLAEAEMLLLAGVFNREILFRWFGILVALLTSGDMLINQALPVLYERLQQPPLYLFPHFVPATPAPDRQLAVSFLVAALLFYASALVIPRRWKALITSENEATSLRAFSYLAALMLFVSLWLAFPISWTAVLWIAAAFLLIVLSRALSVADLSYQAHLFAIAAFLRALDVNSILTLPFLHTGISLRLVTLSLVIALLYLCARWLSVDVPASTLSASELYTSAAALLFGLLAYRECRWVWIATTWGAFALVLALVGYYRNRRDLCLQSHLLVLAGFARTLFINIDATHEWHHFTFRFLTFTLMAALLYSCAYFSGPRGADYARLFSALHTWCGSILIAVLAFEEVSSPWIAVAWALFALLLLIIGDRVKRNQLHYQAYLLSVSALFQIVTVNFTSATPFSLFPAVTLRLVTVSLAGGVFYLCARWAAKGEFSFAAIAAAAYAWAASGLVVSLLYYEVAAAGVALAWALFALALFELGLYRKSLNWRLQSYAIFALSFLRIVFFNVNNSPRQLILATLPVAIVFYYAFARLTHLAAAPSRDFAPHREGTASAPAVALVSPFALDLRLRAAETLAYLGSATLVIFAGSFFTGGSILVSWAALSFLFIGVAWQEKLDVFLHHSVILAFLVFFRAIGFELQLGGRGGISGELSTIFYVSVASAILFAAQAFAFPLRARFAASRAKPASDLDHSLDTAALLGRPEQIYFFLPFLLITVMILNEVSFGRVTIAWGLEAVVAFLFALVVGERSFRLAALALLLICVAKISLLDVWSLHGSDRYVTLIILGVVLLLVSYLYTRYSEAIRRYL